MPDNKVNTQHDSVDETVSYRNGFNFEFEDANHLINVHCSSVTGKESIYLDGKLVASKRSFRRKSSMTFSIDGDNYEVELNVVDILKGETHCTLIKNNLHVKTIKKALLKKNQISGKQGWMKVSVIFVFGLICGSLSVFISSTIIGG